MRSRVCSAVLSAGLVLGMTPASWGQVTAVSRLSSLRATGFCGNGPVSQSYDQTVTETGLLTSGLVVHDHTTLFDHATWGSSVAENRSTQDIRFTTRPGTAIGIVGYILPNESESNVLRAAANGSSPITEGKTESYFEYVFSVVGTTSWAITIDATRNPTAAFAARLQNVNTGANVYLCPLTTPVSDASSGTLTPGTYRFTAYANTRAFTTPGNPSVLDSSISRFTLLVGCPADFDGDGFLSGDDFDAYVLAFEIGDPAADFNADGFISGDDFDAYVESFETGC